VTYQTASLELGYSSGDPSPGKVWLDVNMDGIEEWAWNGTGMGSVGDQTTFSDGSSNDSIAVSGGSNSSKGINLPTSSQLFSSQLSSSFIPTFGGGMHSIGQLLDLEIGDIDNDGKMELVFLSDEPDGNSSNNKSIGWMDWDANTSSMTNVSWAETCPLGVTLQVGDVNNDSIADIGVVDSDSSGLCLHLSNSTVGYNSSFVNVTVGQALSAIDFADMNDDGYMDVVSVHATGEVSVRFFQSATTTFAENATEVVMVNGTPMPAMLENLAVGQIWGPGNGWQLFAADSLSHVTVWAWNVSTTSWMQYPNSLDGAKGVLELVDVNSDGYLDVVGNDDMGHIVSLFNGTHWNTTSGTSMILINSTIADANHDGVLDIVFPNTGAIDGSDFTFAGQLDVHPITSSGIGNAIVNTSFAPVTAPTHIRIADLDGDGRVEHIVAGGEANPGVFIAGWHEYSLDIDQDGIGDINVTGYAGDGNSGQAPLNWSDDMNRVKTAIDALQNSAPSMQDLWANDYFTVAINVSAQGQGEVLLHSLKLTYDATFSVDLNPYASGNLSNVLNQLMEAGTGTFSIPLPFASTSTGVLTLKNLAAIYTDGAPQLLLPPTP